MLRIPSLMLLLALLLPGTLSAQPSGTPTRKESDDPPDKPKPPARVGGKTIHEWMQDIRAVPGDPSVKSQAIQLIPHFGEYSAEAATLLAWVINFEPDIPLKTYAAMSLEDMEVKDKDVPEVVKALVGQLGNMQITLRYHCIVTLGRFQEKAVAAIPFLLRSASDRDSWELRQASLNALYRIGGKFGSKADPRVVQAIINGLTDSASKVKEEAVMLLATIGRIENQDLRIAMLKAMRLRVGDRDKVVVIWAYFGLMLNDKVSIDFLTEIAKYIKTGDVPAKIHALRALGMLKREAKPKLADIIEALKDEDPWVVSTALNVLAYISESVDPGPRAIENIEAIIKDKKTNPQLKQIAQNCLDKITGKDKAAKKEENEKEK